MTPPFSTERIKEILDLALERPTADRAAFISGMCGGDTAMLGEVLSLLHSLESVGTILEPKPLAETAVPAEPLTGLRFGPYRVTERIGAGGMGVVYKAEDTRLGRTVAVKALPAHLAMDPHRRARFEHEARVLASLNHPNIEGIYGVDDTARGPVLVLEYVPGESLAQRVARGAVPFDEARPIARQILRALEASHGAGVVHRDLKPANIHVLADGTAKVLDFGIAKVDPAPLVGPSPSTPGGPPPLVVTGPATMLGTASYMSPEQARGKPVDRRTDLWAFGCVLYEMLVGRRAFEGETFSDTLAMILRAEPDWSRLPADTPGGVVRLIRRCLARDPDQRVRDAGDARLDLEEVDDVGDGARALRRRVRRAGAVAFGGGAVLSALGAGVAWVLWAPAARPPERPADRAVRFSLRVAPEAAVSGYTSALLAISPDGGTLVYGAGSDDHRRLIKRSLDSQEWVELPGTKGANTPFFSPDGAWIGFASDGQLKRVPVRGGGAEVVVAEGVGGFGCAWSPDGRIVFSNAANGFSLLESVGGSARVLTVVDRAHYEIHTHPEFVPGSDAVLFTVCDGAADAFKGRIDAVRVAGGERQTVYPAACCPRFLPAMGERGGRRSAGSPGRLMFWQSGSLLVAPFDPRTLRVTGTAAPIAALAEQLEAAPMMRFAAAQNGSVLATVAGNITYDVGRLAWFDPAGKTSIITTARFAFDTPCLAPEHDQGARSGGRIVFINGATGVGDLWIYDLGRGAPVLLPDTHESQHPLWTRDGQRIAFATTPPPDGPGSIRWIPADQSAGPEVLWSGTGKWSGYPSSFTPDGRTLLMTASNGGDPASQDLYVYDLDKRERERLLFPTRAVRLWPRLSPDGSLLAYTSVETGHFEVYLHRYPDLSEKTPISVGGGYRPTWSPDGRALYYQWGNSIFAVDIESVQPLRVSRQRTVLERAPDLRFDVAGDGRILMPHPRGDWGVQDTIDVTIGWEGLVGTQAARP